MSNAVAIQEKNLAAVESALVSNDLSKLTTQERLTYYKQVCESVGLNHLTNPFAYITLNGKLTLYAKKDATEQLRKIHGVSTQIVSIKIENDFCDVHIRGKDKTGREDEEFASVYIKGSSGEGLANAKMKAITKAKRRVTLSLCGLGILDESELESIPADAKMVAEQPQIESPFANDDGPEFEPVQVVAENTSLGSFVCRVGKKYAGKTLEEIDIFELDNYLTWLKDSSAKKNQPLQGDWLEFAEKAEEFLKSREVPKLNESEELN